MRRAGRAVAVLGALLLLAGCGDGDGGDGVFERPAPAASSAEEAASDAPTRSRVRAPAPQPGLAEEIEGHLEVLREGYPGEGRQRSIDALARLGGAAVPRLAGALRSPREPRGDIAAVLEAIGPAARAAIPDLEALVLENHRYAAFAFRALVAIGPEGVASIARMLREGPDEARRLGLDMLAQSGAAPVPALLPTLERMASHGDAEARARAIEAFAVTGRGKPGAAAALVGWLGDEDPVVRQAAAGGLLQMGTDGRDAVPALVHALSDESGEVRYQALLALAQFGADARDAVPVLHKLARSNAPLAGHAAYPLRAIGGVRALEPLMQCSADVRLVTVLEAARGDPSDPARTRILALATGDPSADVRAAAVTALEQAPSLSTDWQVRLTPLMTDPREDLRRMAAALLARTGEASGETTAALLGATSDAAATVRSAALEALSRCAPADARFVAQAVVALRDADARVVEAACRAVGRAQSSDTAVAIPDLRSLMSSGAPPVRVAAAFALARLEPSPDAAFEALRRLEVHDDWKVRLAVVEALAELPRAEAVAILVSRLDDRSPHVRLAATHAAARLGPLAVDAIPRLEAMAKSRDFNISRAAAAALAAIRR